MSLNLSDECVSTKLRVTGNHGCFILVVLNCISLYTHVYWALSNSIYYYFPQLSIYLYIYIYIYRYIYLYIYINIMRGKKDVTTFPDKPVLWIASLFRGLYIYRSSWSIGRQQQSARDHLFVVPTIWANHFGDVKGKSCY